MEEAYRSSSTLNRRYRTGYGPAWVTLCFALAAHVTDEALTDFLSVYNPAVETIRRRIPFLPLPIFNFRVWLTGLIFAILFLLALSPFAFRGAKWMVPLTYGFGGLMIVNGLGHIAGSVYMGKLMPGVYSSPVLLISAGYLIWKVRRRRDSGSRV